MRRNCNGIKVMNVLCIVIAAAGALLTVQSASAVEGLVTVKRDAMVLTVGGAQADIPGYTTRAIQTAVNALKTSGGGTVKLGPGRYDITAPVFLYSRINLVGSGSETVLRKADGFHTSYIIDADYGMYKVTVQDPSGFRVGMGIQLYDDACSNCWDVTVARITSIDGNVLYIDTGLVRDYQARLNGFISTSGSVVECIDAADVRIADFVADGNKAKNDPINGCRGGGIYAHRSRNVTVENVIVRNFNGDSFSWQITENITVRNCEAASGTGLGFHPGTGSDSSVIEGCSSHNNGSDGIFLCWRVQHGIFRNNTVYANGGYGISIGHKDTDNLFENNHVYENNRHGVYFREESEENAGHRNTFHGNVIENNGASGFKAYGFNIDGETHDIIIEGNIIRSTGKGNQTGGVFIGPRASRIQADKNTFSGHPGVLQ